MQEVGEKQGGRFQSAIYFYKISNGLDHFWWAEEIWQWNSN